MKHISSLLKHYYDLPRYHLHAKDGQSACNSWRFTRQKTAFGKPKSRLLQGKRQQAMAQPVANHAPSNKPLPVLMPHIPSVCECQIHDQSHTTQRDGQRQSSTTVIIEQAIAKKQADGKPRLA